MTYERSAYYVILFTQQQRDLLFYPYLDQLVIDLDRGMGTFLRSILISYFSGQVLFYSMRFVLS